ncbi:hypothetical protein [Marinicella litoralis]|uniref:Uncharacterized protein n=1 Tax=Marinicella litoralis TaxID=644220 RepID=A0A4R6XRP4_9GAMM|nr:hypothetical protein [Marinicella litoralis]TDR22406.1 hypothetical protein C8D91_0894 [Marinicella litoralis]
MRVAAGVILIIAAIFNLLASLVYLGGGAATTSLSNVADSAYVQSQQMTEAEKAELEKFQDEAGGSGILMMAFGVFLLVSVGILIAGAVFLFQDKKPQFIMVAGGMAIVAEVIGILVTQFGVTNTIGLVGGILAIISAKSMGGSAAPVDVE